MPARAFNNKYLDRKKRFYKARTPFYPSNGTFKPPAIALNEKASPTDVITSPTSDPVDVEKVKSKRMRQRRNKWTLIITFSSLVLIIIFITIAYLIAKVLLTIPAKSCDPDNSCDGQIIETIPDVLNYSASVKHEAISKHWKILLNLATNNVHILSSYWTLRGGDVMAGVYPQSKVGEEIFQLLKNVSHRGVKVRIVQQFPTVAFPQQDTAELSKGSNIEVRSLDLERLLGGGIIHTKSMIVDGMHFYVGSANFDWRSLTEVKELGTVIYNCSCAAGDMQKIFDINWDMATSSSSVPSHWPAKYETKFSKENPMILKSSNARAYISTSPPKFCTDNRTSDIDAILDIISKAKRFIYIAVMDYYAAIIYSQPKRYWGVIDNALRRAMYDNGVKVKMLSSKWVHLSNDQIIFLRSLNDFGKLAGNGSIEVKWYTIPPSPIPFTRVNHNKYMVTDNAAFISTSNWAGDYFTNTGGISVVYNQTDSIYKNEKIIKDTYQGQLVEIFQRDWNSKFSEPLV